MFLYRKYKQKIKQLQDDNDELERKNQKLLEDNEKLKQKYESLSSKMKSEKGDDLEAISSKKSGYIYTTFSIILVIYIVFSLWTYSILKEEYQNQFFTLVTILVTFCFEPLFKLFTRKYSTEEFRVYFEPKMNWLKLGLFFLLTIIYWNILRLKGMSDIDWYKFFHFLK